MKHLLDRLNLLALLLSGGLYLLALALAVLSWAIDSDMPPLTDTDRVTAERLGRLGK